MKTISHLKNSTAAIVLTIGVIACSTISAAAQRKIGKKSPIASQNKNLKQKKVAPRTISAGVLNGKAKNLFKPEFPLTAKAVNTYGVVKVDVLIDENGDVIEATATGGHLFLRPPSIKAALASKFEPVKINGAAIRVRGIIIYHFASDYWNWLEIGYTLNRGSSYYTIESLLKVLSAEFEAEKQLLNQRSNNLENRDQIIETVTASIKSKISGDAKSLWLLEIGAALSEAKRQRYHAGNFQRTNQTIRCLLLSAPPEVSANLILRLKRFNQLIETVETAPPDSFGEDSIYRFLNDIEGLFPELGK